MNQNNQHSGSQQQGGGESAKAEISSRVVADRRPSRSKIPETRSRSGGLVSPHLISRTRIRAVGAAARKAERVVVSWLLEVG
jgi:hypothetical protein